MTISSIKLSITINDLDADEDAVEFLEGWLRAATFSALMGHQRDRFRFRGTLDSGIEVKTEQTCSSSQAQR